MARIKFLEHHTAEGNNETLQAKFDDIICEAEVKLLDAAIDSLSRDVEANQDELGEREEDIDGTIAQWRTHLARNKNFRENYFRARGYSRPNGNGICRKPLLRQRSRSSFESITSGVSLKESKLRESMDSNETFVPSEQSICEIISLELHRTQCSTCRWQPTKEGLPP